MARAAYGLGRGFGKEKTRDEQGLQEERPAGESGGGGILVSPLGVVEVTGEETRFVPIRRGQKAKWSGAFIAGLVVGALLWVVRKAPVG